LGVSAFQLSPIETSSTTSSGIRDGGSGGGTVTPSTIAILPISNVGFTGNVYIDGILWGGYRWGSGSSPTVIDYSFWNDGTEGYDDPWGGDATNAYDWFSGERAAMVR
jgi:hypothetical protein